MLTLYIGNKNYSSWSMRPWLAMKQAGLPFTERMVRFDSFGSDSRFKHEVLQVNPGGRVPGAGGVGAYVEGGYATPAMKSWVDDALAEQDFVAFDEPYRKQR